MSNRGTLFPVAGVHNLNIRLWPDFSRQNSEGGRLPRTVRPKQTSHRDDFQRYPEGDANNALVGGFGSFECLGEVPSQTVQQQFSIYAALAASDAAGRRLFIVARRCRGFSILSIEWAETCLDPTPGCRILRNLWNRFGILFAALSICKYAASREAKTARAGFECLGGGGGSRDACAFLPSGFDSASQKYVNPERPLSCVTSCHGVESLSCGRKTACCHLLQLLSVPRS